MENNYKKSFLLFWHIILGLVFTLFTYLLITDYIRKDKLIGIALSLSILSLYLFLLKHTINLFNKEKTGLAYFFTIGGFLVASFIQVITCANFIPFGMH